MSSTPNPESGGAAPLPQLVDRYPPIGLVSRGCRVGVGPATPRHVMIRDSWLALVSFVPGRCDLHACCWEIMYILYRPGRNIQKRKSATQVHGHAVDLRWLAYAMNAPRHTSGAVVRVQSYANASTQPKDGAAMLGSPALTTEPWVPGSSIAALRSYRTATCEIIASTL
jgi:hypothetical protein